MTVNSQRLLLAAAGAGGAAAAGLYVDDVFSTTVWDGTGSAQTITNGIDLDGEGGMVWTKVRNVTDSHTLQDSERGKTGTYFDEFASDATYASQTTRPWGITSFNSNGFSLAGDNLQFNSSGRKYCSWVFRKAPGFFDCVTWTGNGVAGREISHALGSVPGCMIIKRIDSAGNWVVYHRSIGASPAASYYLYLQTDDLRGSSGNYFDDTAPTASVFTLGASNDVNASSATYVAYLFAHDDQSFGTDSDEAIIKCDGYTGNGTSGHEINVGFEPQWLMIKRTSGNQDWMMFDNMRGLPVGRNDTYLEANNSIDEQTSDPFLDLTATGFRIINTNTVLNGSGSDYVYIAIRRPHKPPEAGTDVYTATAYTGAGGNSRLLDVGLVPDFVHFKSRNWTSTTANNLVFDRLRGAEACLFTNSTAAEATSPDLKGLDRSDENVILDTSHEFNENTYLYIANAFKRAPGFFDVVAYTGTSSARTINHNLGEIPELMIVKARSSTGGAWVVFHKDADIQDYIQLQSNAAATDFGSPGAWNSTDPTSSVFSVSGAGWDVNNNGTNYVNYLFASLAGISKVGSYTGTGSNVGVDCGFTAGARFVMIKRTDSTGDWYYWDTARGIVGGNDPYLRFNVANTEVDGTDYIDPLNSGFTVTSSAPADLNASGGTYIFFAIA